MSAATLPARARIGRRPGVGTVYAWELRKLRAQKRTYLGLGMAALVPLTKLVLDPAFDVSPFDGVAVVLGSALSCSAATLYFAGIERVLDVYGLGASGVGLWEVEWTTVLAVAGMTTLLSLLSSVASAPVGADHHSPSLLPPPAHAAPAGALPQQRTPDTLLPASG